MNELQTIKLNQFIADECKLINDDFEKQAIEVWKHYLNPDSKTLSQFVEDCVAGQWWVFTRSN